MLHDGHYGGKCARSSNPGAVQQGPTSKNLQWHRPHKLEIGPHLRSVVHDRSDPWVQHSKRTGQIAQYRCHVRVHEVCGGQVGAAGVRLMPGRVH